MSLFYSFREDEKFYYYKSKNRKLQFFLAIILAVCWFWFVIFARFLPEAQQIYSFIILFVIVVASLILFIFGTGKDGFRFWIRRRAAFFKGKQMSANRTDFFNAEWKIEK